MRLIDRLESYIIDHQLFPRGSRILLGISGGIDSVCLLHLFYMLQSKWCLTLSLVHINHGLRGAEADRDEMFVCGLARHYGLPFFSMRTSVRLFAIEKRLSVEEAAREVRFRFFKRILKQLHYDRVALAHQGDDQAETILMHVIRGSGIRGLTGIRPIRDHIIHPLLFASRHEIENYQKLNNLSFVQDHTNREKRFFRNKLRWDVLSKLKSDSGPQIVNTINRIGSAALETQDFLEHIANKAISRTVISRSEREIILDIYHFLGYFKTIQKTLLVQILEQFFTPLRRATFHDINRVIQLAHSGKSGSQLTLGSEVRVIRSGSQLIFTQNVQDRIQDFKVSLNRCLTLRDFDIQFCTSILSKEKSRVRFTKDSNSEFLDLDKIKEPLVIRTVQQGDWFIPLGMKGKKKLQDFFVDLHVPNYYRSLIPLLVCGEDIVWVMGYRLDDRFKIVKTTKRILKVEIRRIDRI